MNCEHDDLDDSWECPTCLRPMPAKIDYECGTCETMASHHLSVTTLCKLLRETQRRESSLIVESKEQARLLGMSAERECDLRGKLERERALADRLADCLNNLWHHHSLTEASYDYIDEALAAWKEARSE